MMKPQHALAALALAALSACGPADQGTPDDKTGSVETYTINGRHLDCLHIRPGAYSAVMSCDWVGFHATDTTEVK